MTERWLRIVGLITWLVAGSTALLHYATHPDAPGLVPWAISYLSFGVLVWIASERRLTPSVRAAALVGQAGLAIFLSHLGMPLFEGALLALVAAQMATILPLWVSISWALAQAVPLAIILSRTYDRVETTKSITSYLGFSAFAIAAVHFFEAERRARLERSRTVSELVATRAFLEQSTRVAERVRISHDLHDVLGHHLVALSIHLDLARRTAAAEARGPLDETYASVRRMLADARNAVHELHDKDAIDLGVTLRTLVDAIPGTNIELDVPEHLSISDPERAQVAFRCVQEAVTNALKHAKASKIEIIIKREPGKLEVQVKDNGRGFATLKEGVGLKAMRARIEGIGGTLEIVSSPNGGTSVRAVIPLREVEMIRVILADDQQLVRHGIKGLLGLTGDIEVVGEAADGLEAVDVILRTKPDIALLDVQMPGGSGIDCLRELRKRKIEIKTIMLTTFNDDEVLLQAIKEGAVGFLLKDVSLEDLAKAIRDVAAGKTIHKPMTEGDGEVMRDDPADFPASELPVSLTDRELEVLRLLARGMSNREIADVLGTAEGTVKNQMSSILQKLGVRDRTRAVLKAAELRLL